MRFRSTLVLLVIAVVIGLAIFILHKLVPPTEQWDKLKKSLFPTDTKDITALQIKKERETILLELDKNKVWQITAPLKTKADKSEVENGLVFEIGHLEKKGAISTANLADYGLDKPRVTLQVTTKDNKTCKFHFGQEIALGPGVYLQKEGDRNIYTADDSFWKAVNKTLFDFRDKKVTTIDSSSIQSIVLRRSLETIELARKETDKWEISKPIQEPAQGDKIRSVLSELDGLQAKSFPAEHPMSMSDYLDYGLSQPVLSITISGANYGETILWGTAVVSDTSKIYAQRQGENPIITLDFSTFTNLNVPLNDFRSRKLFDIAFDKVKRIETTKSANELLVGLDKISNEWKLITPTGVALEWNGVSEFIRTINQTEIEDFVADNVTDLTSFGLDAPLLTARLSFENQADLVIALSPTTDLNYTYLKRSDENRVVKIKSELFNRIEKGVLPFRKKSILDISRAAVTRCVIEKGGVKVICEQEKPDVWNIIGEQTQKLEDTAGLTAILDKVGRLVVKEFIAENPSDLTSYGLDKPTDRVEISYIQDNQPATKTLLIGKKTKDGDYYGMIEGEGLVFLLSAETVEPLQKDIKK